jgi:hypothetical protein
MKIRNYDIITGKEVAVRPRPLPLTSQARRPDPPAQPRPLSRCIESASVNNVSAYHFNIISHNRNPVQRSNHVSLRKKNEISALGCFAELFTANVNEHHRNTLSRDTRAFYRKKEVCTNFCDQAKAYGPHTKPFVRFEKLP